METKVLLGTQTGKGVPKITGMNTISATDFGVKQESSKIESKVLTSGRWKADSMPGRSSVQGDFGMEPNVSEIEKIIECAGFVKSGDKYVSSAFDKYMTLVNDFKNDGLNLQYSDCLVNTININASQEAYLSVKVGVIGTEAKINNAAYSGNAPFLEGARLVCYGAKLLQNTTDLSANVESVDININNSLEGKGGLNTRTFTKILQNGRGEIELTVQFNAFEKTNYIEAMEMLKANTSTSLTLKLQEDIANDTAKSGKVLEITMPNVKMTNVEIGDLEGAGTITKTMTALPDATGNPIYFKITTAPGA